MILKTINYSELYYYIKHIKQKGRQLCLWATVSFDCCHIYSTRNLGIILDFSSVLFWFSILLVRRNSENFNLVLLPIIFLTPGVRRQPENIISCCYTNPIVRSWENNYGNILSSPGLRVRQTWIQIPFITWPLLWLMNPSDIWGSQELGQLTSI